MFFKDREAASRDISTTERYIQKLRNMLRDEGLREIEDMSLGFGSIIGDGDVSSLGTWARDDIDREAQLKQPYIEEYLNQIPSENLVIPSTPKSEPDYQHDDHWDSEPIVDDDSESRSTVAKDAKRRHRIDQIKQLGRGRPSGLGRSRLGLIEHFCHIM